MYLPALRLSDTLRGVKEEFSPLDPPNVRMYVCGPTVYDVAHIGHARPAVFFDVVRSYMERLGYRVSLVTNVTDIDDKIIKRANEEGVSFREVAERYEREYFEAMSMLGVSLPTVVPRATDYIDDMIRVVEGLIERGHAYATERGDVYFDVSTFPEYGKLSKVRVEELVAGARVEPGEGKRSPEDFALWKAAAPGEPSWPSPWGPGRPGWHIECSAMILRLLGPQIDIHGGGQDLVFPHHENEIAQMEAYTGKSPFVRYWMHVGLVTVKGEKMAKSLKNYFAVKVAAEEFGAEALRAFLLSAHYRSPLEFSPEAVRAAGSRLESWQSALMRAEAYLRESGPSHSLSSEDLELREKILSARAAFFDAMSDDFDTPKALAALDAISAAASKVTSESLAPNVAAEAVAALRDLMGVLGFEVVPGAASAELERVVNLLVQVRSELRRRKIWDLADTIRSRLGELGIRLEDRGEETVWWIEG
ncbi:MAG: cysteine--tRNA ligase [Candidatus Korarchaeota archaeon]|nr:cysteine--tRNA ligase [Candidatus Korarchaeota archaeon]